MPRKIRQLRADLLDAGFEYLHNRGKGDHRQYQHPKYRHLLITLDGHSGDDAKPYQERDVRKAIAELKELESGRGA